MTFLSKASLFPKKISTTATLLGALILAAGCKQNTNPVKFSISVPDPNTIQMQTVITQRLGLGLSGSYDIINGQTKYGSVYLTPENATQGFGFGFTLNTAVFLKESWVNYEEVTTLPTGASFPQWMFGGVVDVRVPPANTKQIDWHFYFGTADQFYVGAAAVIPSINGKFPSLQIEYAFHDDQGRVVLGLLFFGPKTSNGNLDVPGGIFIGTNLTPFMPKELKNVVVGGNGISSTSQALTLKTLTRAALTGAPLKINGKSVTGYIAVTGRDKGKYKSKKSIEKVLNRFIQSGK